MVEEMEKTKKKIVHRLHITINRIAICSCGRWGYKSEDAQKIRREFEKHKMVMK
jgi:hypothetical protein